MIHKDPDTEYSVYWQILLKKHRFFKKFIPKQSRYPSLGRVTLNAGQAIPSLKLERKEITWFNEMPIIYNEKAKDKIKWDLSALLS